MTEIVQNGKHFKLTITTGSKVIQNEFTLGEECELETMTGEKVKVGAAPHPPATLCFRSFSWSLVPGRPPSGAPLTTPSMDTLSLNLLLGREAERQGQQWGKTLLGKASPRTV